MLSISFIFPAIKRVISNLWLQILTKTRNEWPFLLPRPSMGYNYRQIYQIKHWSIVEVHDDNPMMDRRNRMSSYFNEGLSSFGHLMIRRSNKKGVALQKSIRKPAFTFISPWRLIMRTYYKIMILRHLPSLWLGIFNPYMDICYFGQNWVVQSE